MRLHRLHARPYPENVIIDHEQVVTRGETIGRIEDIGFAPTDELLSGLQGDRPAIVEQAQVANGKIRSMEAAIVPVQSKVALGLPVCVHPGLGAAGQLETWRQTIMTS